MAKPLATSDVPKLLRNMSSNLAIGLLQGLAPAAYADLFAKLERDAITLIDSIPDDSVAKARALLHAVQDAGASFDEDEKKYQYNRRKRVLDLGKQLSKVIDDFGVGYEKAARARIATRIQRVASVLGDHVAR